MISVLSLFSLGLGLNLGTKQLRHSSGWTGAKVDPYVSGNRKASAIL